MQQNVFWTKLTPRFVSVCQPVCLCLTCCFVFSLASQNIFLSACLPTHAEVIKCAECATCMVKHSLPTLPQFTALSLHVPACLRRADKTRKMLLGNTLY